MLIISIHCYVLVLKITNVLDFSYRYYKVPRYVVSNEKIPLNMR